MKDWLYIIKGYIEQINPFVVYLMLFFVGEDAQSQERIDLLYLTYF